MVLGICQLVVQLPEAQSLKEKRRSVKSVTQRVRHRYNVSIAEVGSLDMWQVAEIGFVAASNSTRHADETVQRVLRFIEENLTEGFVADVRTEIVHVD